MTTSETLFQFIHKKIRPRLMILSIIMALGSGVLAGGFSLYNKIESARRTLFSVAPHVASLLEISDRAEVQRSALAISHAFKSDVVVEKDGVVFATSRTTAEMDRPFIEPISILRIFGTSLQKTTFVVSENAQRVFGPEINAKIILISDLWPIIKDAILAAGLSLVALLALGYLLSIFLEKTVNESIQPIVELDRSIIALSEFEPNTAIVPSGILEIDRIQQTIKDAGAAVVDAKDRIAAVRAKELSSEAYKRLIHDLHTPISALQQKASIISNPEIEPKVKVRSFERVVELSEQILSQINAAKSQLELEVSYLREEDLRRSVECAIEQVSSDPSIQSTANIECKIPNEPIQIPHDPNLMRRAVSNLLKNALSFCQGRVIVELEQSLSTVSIRIMDDGPGMCAADVGLHLQGRGRSQNANRKSFGLSSVNHIVRSHGGKIVYSTSPFGGACFEIRM